MPRFRAGHRPEHRAIQEQLRGLWPARAGVDVRRAPKRSGWDGALSPSTPSSRIYAATWGLSSSARLASRCAGWATRSPRSVWPRRRRFRWLPGAAARWKRWPTPFATPSALGYPLLIKATAGGGGHGIRRVHSPDELPRAFESARAEAFKAFGNPTVFMEQLVTGARHVEVQIIADHHGNTWAAGVRDCTIQRRHQKILEEAPSPALSPCRGSGIARSRGAPEQAVGYQNAGTVEFLYQPQQPALRVHGDEHPAAGGASGHRVHHRIDLVKLQIRWRWAAAWKGNRPRPSDTPSKCA